MISIFYFKYKHGNKNYWDQGLSYLSLPNAEVDNTWQSLEDSRYDAKTEFNFITYYYNFIMRKYGIWSRIYVL